MLILTRKKGERIMLGDDLIVTFLEYDMKYRNARIGIEAHPSISIHREEIYNKIKAQQAMRTRNLRS